MVNGSILFTLNGGVFRSVVVRWNRNFVYVVQGAGSCVFCEVLDRVVQDRM